MLRASVRLTAAVEGISWLFALGCACAAGSNRVADESTSVRYEDLVERIDGLSRELKRLQLRVDEISRKQETVNNLSADAVTIGTAKQSSSGANSPVIAGNGNSVTMELGPASRRDPWLITEGQSQVLLRSLKSVSGAGVRIIHTGGELGPHLFGEKLGEIFRAAGWCVEMMKVGVVGYVGADGIPTSPRNVVVVAPDASRPEVKAALQALSEAEIRFSVEKEGFNGELGRPFPFVIVTGPTLE